MHIITWECHEIEYTAVLKVGAMVTKNTNMDIMLVEEITSSYIKIPESRNLKMN